MAWKKIAFYDEVAILSDATPLLEGGAAAQAGTNSLCSRDDHVHALGPLTANFNANQNQFDGMVFEKSVTNVDAASEVEGQIFYNNNTSNQHALVWVP